MITKEFDKIISDDVIKYPIWEWAFEAQDDELSTCSLSIIPIDKMTYHAHIIFTINNTFNIHGLIFDICNPPKNFRLHDLRPRTFGIFLGGFMEVFDFIPDIHLTNEIKKHLNLSEDLFSISWRLAVLFEGETQFRSGIIL